jgi:hypothetical protein
LHCSDSIRRALQAKVVCKDTRQRMSSIVSYLKNLSSQLSIVAYLFSLKADAEEVDLSTFELIEDLNDATWWKLKSNKSTKRVKLPPSLLTIRNHALFNQSQLTDVTFPSSLRSIEHLAFYQCTGLAMNDFKVPDSLEELGNSAFNSCEGLTGKLSTHIAASSSFYGCTGLTALDLSNCKVIEEWCFAGCAGLIVLNLPSSLHIIRKWAFRNCTSLTDPLIIPPFVKYIHPQAFEGCTGMPGRQQAIVKHFQRYESWKTRGNVLMTLITFDEEYRRVVEENGGRLHSELSNAFLADYSKDAQLIYKATAHVDGTDNLANGICRIILSFLPMKKKYYGTQLSNEEVDDIDSDKLEEEDGFYSDDY